MKKNQCASLYLETHTKKLEHPQVTSPNRITIIIPAYNQLGYCRSCIQSIQANTRRNHHLVLVDNASTDGVADYFDSIPNATVIHAPQNLGFAGGVNLGLAIADGHVVILNSDTLVPPDWLSHLEAALHTHPDWGMLGPVTNCASGEQQLNGLAFNGPDAVDAYGNQRWEELGPSVRPTNRLAGFCLLIRDTVWQQVGEFDTRFGIGNYEDDDYCTRVRQAGKQLGIAEGCFIFHFGGRTFEGMGLHGEAYAKLMEENRRKYMEKWNVFLPEPGRGAGAQAAALRQEAELALQRGELNAALTLYRKAVATDPHTAENFFGLAEALLHGGHLRLGFDTYLAGLKLAPAHHEAARRAWDLATQLGLEDTLRNLNVSP